MNVLPPIEMQSPEIVYTVFYWLFVIQLVPAIAWLLTRAFRTRDLLPLGALAGSLVVAYFTPPVYDYLTLVWWPTNIPFTYIIAFGIHDPIVDFASYVLFFGCGGYFVYLQIARGISKSTMVLLACAFGLADLIYEVPFLHLGLYTYYGDQPLTIGGFPTYWLACNSVIVLITGTIMHMLMVNVESPRTRFTRAALATALAAALSFIPLVPIGVMLHADVPSWARTAAALLSIAISLNNLRLVANYAGNVARSKG